MEFKQTINMFEFIQQIDKQMHTCQKPKTNQSFQGKNCNRKINTINKIKQMTKDHNHSFKSDPSENCHLTVKKLPKTYRKNRTKH